MTYRRPLSSESTRVPPFEASASSTSPCTSSGVWSLATTSSRGLSATPILTSTRSSTSDVIGARARLVHRRAEGRVLQPERVQPLRVARLQRLEHHLARRPAEQRRRRLRVRIEHLRGRGDGLPQQPATPQGQVTAGLLVGDEIDDGVLRERVEPALPRGLASGVRAPEELGGLVAP